MAKLKSKTVISETPPFKHIRKWYEENLHPDANNYDDPKVYQYVYHEGNFAGTFQCIEENSYVELEDHTYKKIRDIKVGDMVRSYDETKKEFCYDEVINVFDKGEQQCVEIKLFFNESLICTADHEIMTLDQGWIKAGELKIGDNIITRSAIQTPDHSDILEIKDVGVKHVFDIETKKHHNFTANNVVVHNCTSSGAQKLFQKAKPENITDIAVLTSIYRPGPLAANVDKIYLDAKKGKKFEWGHPLVNNVLKDTYQALIFQEDVMSLAENVGGFPKDKCDNVRRAIMKRDHSKGAEAIAEVEKMESEFVEGAMKKGVEKAIATQVYKNIKYFSGYAFNKSVYQNETVKIYTKNGKYKKTIPINKVKPGDYLKSRDEKSQKTIFVKVKDLHDHGVLDLVEVELKSGQRVKCTWDHKFRTQETGEMLPLWMIKEKNLSIVI